MAMAAADVFGAIFAFGAVEVSFASFNGSLAIRALDFLLLLGIFVVSLRVALRGLRPPSTQGTKRISSILVGSFGIFLLVATFFSFVFLFSAAS
jgi:membrane protein implicated in regulation of membrane protease activity